ncbi:MAG: TRAP transporter permease [Rhodospirillales bacterium]|jgi:TRAP transporter 4TM/12TM fusion protein|nr:TRAP transporter permease [Rhodospirillales bacterium]
MAEAESPATEPAPEDLENTLEEIEYTGRQHAPRVAIVIGFIAALWSIFQLWIASPLPFIFDFAIIVDVPARGIHLAFGLLLCFLIFPASRRQAGARIPLSDLVLALVATGCALYMWLGWEGLSERAGILLTYDLSIFGFEFTFPIEAIIGGTGIVLLLEATRRSIGLPLVVVATIFLLYSIFGQSMPDIISHKGVSLTRLTGYQWLGGEAIFGIPIDVSVSFVFLFVLFGAMLDKAGAGKYFLDLAFAMVGRFRGGPAKAAILASGMTGLISGSSIANTVTTGTFTIPVMKRIGIPAVKAGAIEVAASVNGQIMPPIMGAAAFIIAELVGITYFDVIVAAFIPAFICYIALLYISHLEAMKLGLKRLPAAEIPPLRETFLSGVHFIIPIVVLVYLLMVERWTPASSVFYSILLMMVIVVVQHVIAALRGGDASVGRAVTEGLIDIYAGLIAGARNMITIAVAVAAAGIIVGSVSSTGLNNALVGVVEAISGGNVFILLAMTSVLCIILGMGLPTTANYLVVASLLAGVVVELGNAAGLVFPLIAVHLYVFYFGLMADVTPPVALAAFAASAISRADPIKTGIQAFYYEIRTAILPVVFIFNPELLLIGVESVWHGIAVFIIGLIAILSFSSLTQNFMFARNKVYEAIILAVVTVALFRPDVFMDRVYPAFATADLKAFAAGEAVAKPGYTIRLHVVRQTEYGDRFKLYSVATPGIVPDETYGRYGLKVEPADGRFEVTALEFNGLAEQRGIEVGDIVTDVDVETVGRPAKEWVYPFAFALLGLVMVLQLMRRRRDSAAAPSTP